MYNGQTISKIMYEFERATNEHQIMMTDGGNANIFQMSTLIHRIANCPFKMTLILINVILHKNLHLDN